MKFLSLAVLVPSLAWAHFTLQTPPSFQKQDIFGDPQKAPPCGGDDGTATNQVTTFHPGDTVNVVVNENIFHPGHYRAVLGVNGRADLPDDPVVTAGSTACGSTVIQDPPVFPLLADGQLLHTKAFSNAQHFQVTLPSDVTCTNCTLQIVEFMSDHPLNNPGGCFYHHCATINIVADDGGVLDAPGATNDKGCSCSSGGGVLLALLAVAGLRRPVKRSQLG